MRPKHGLYKKNPPDTEKCPCQILIMDGKRMPTEMLGFLPTSFELLVSGVKVLVQMLWVCCSHLNWLYETSLLFRVKYSDKG